MSIWRAPASPRTGYMLLSSLPAGHSSSTNASSKPRHTETLSYSSAQTSRIPDYFLSERSGLHNVGVGVEIPGAWSSVGVNKYEQMPLDCRPLKSRTSQTKPSRAHCLTSLRRRSKEGKELCNEPTRIKHKQHTDACVGQAGCARAIRSTTTPSVNPVLSCDVGLESPWHHRHPIESGPSSAEPQVRRMNATPGSKSVGCGFSATNQTSPTGDIPPTSILFCARSFAPDLHPR